MNQYKKMKKATIIFPETHWMTTLTNVLYFK